jgi:hypothetical protein
MRLHIDAGLRHPLQDEHYEDEGVDEIAQHDGYGWTIARTAQTM